MATATGEQPDLNSYFALDKFLEKPCQLWLWNATNGKKLRSFTASGMVEALGFSPDGTMLASAGRTTEIWQVSVGMRLQEIKSSEVVKSLAFSPDGKTLTTVDADGVLTQWQVGTGRQARTWKVSADYAFAVAYTPKGDVLITGGDYDGQIKFWDAQTGKLLRSVKAQENAVDALAVSRDGSKVAAGSWDGTVSVWNLKTFQLQSVLKGHSSNVWSVAFSPDSNRIASVSSEIIIWDAATGKRLKTIPDGHMNVSFAYSNQTIVYEKEKRVFVQSLGSR